MRKLHPHWSKTALTFVGLLAIGTGFGQNAVAPEAVALFEKAKAAHGGPALENLKSYRDQGTYTFFDDKGQVVASLQATQIYDFPNERLHLDLYQDSKLIQAMQVGKNEAWSWTQQSGVVKLPNPQAKPLRDSFVQGLFALRAPSKDLETASANGNVKLKDGIEGQGVSLTIKGAKTSYVIASDGTIIGGKETIEGSAEVVSMQSDLRAIDGIKLPFKTESTIAGKPYIYVVLSEAKVNPVLTDADFAQPK